MSTVAKRYQDGSYASQNPGFGDRDAAWKAGHILRMIRRNSIPHTTIAEVGCGGGAILVHLQRELEKDVCLTGYEPMPEGYAKALATRNARLDFQNCGIEELAGDHFDLVLCIDVFEHVEDYFTFLRKLATLGDQFIFHIPLDMNAQMILRGSPILRVRNKVGHLHYFDRDTALAALSECGFSVIESVYTFGGESGYSSVFYALMKLPRRLLASLFPHWTARALGGFSLLVHAQAE
ncbi:MAG TPA: methyltransferase domain-containing protein [Verrucomicrobiales bacterium]|nr:methyltransferase domain-containing protein [Verrucomicrobiales bacterium]